MAHAVVKEKGDVGSNRATLTRLGMAIFFSMNVMVFTFALWAYDFDKSLGSTNLAGSFAALLRAICLLVSLPVLFLLGGPMARNAWLQLRRRSPSTDVLILIGVVAAYAYSAWSVWTNAGSLYVETACVTLVFLTLGRWLEATGKARSLESLRELEHLLPATVTRVGPKGSEDIPLVDVRPGDTLRVSAGQRIPADGVLCSPAASLDQQLVSGESWPVEAVSGDLLTGGTLNLVGDIVMRATAGAGEGTLDRLIVAVRKARLRQGPRQRLADRVTRHFFPFIVLAALGTLAAHWLLDGFASGLLAALAVLLIACPCALGIATPLAIWTTMGTAARRGIVVASGETLERLAAARAIRFDKTGTLTSGTPLVSELVTSDGIDPGEVRCRAFVLSKSSTHVFSRSIAGFCSSAGAERTRDSDLLVVTASGRGVHACFPGESSPTALGSARLMTEFSLAVPADLAEQTRQATEAGRPIVLVGWNGRVKGCFILHEEVRSEVPEVLAECRALGLDVAVLTGDHAFRGARLGEELGVPVTAELDPQRKMVAIEQARRQIGPVVMVGDGLNDAGACSTADVGIALGCGADVTRDSAGVCLVSNDLRHVPWLIELSRKTVKAVRANLLWAFGYNSVGIVLAALGWLHPAIAGVLMVGSSLYVIGNSLRLGSDSNGGLAPHSNSPAADRAAATGQVARAKRSEGAELPIGSEVQCLPLAKTERVA